MVDITKIIRGIKILELEPENIKITYDDEKITEYNVEQLTDFITYSKEKNKIIFPNNDIDKFVNIEDKIILNIYEVLNAKGMDLLFKEENKNNGINIMNIYSYLNKTKEHLNVDGLRDKIVKGHYEQKKDDNNIDINTNIKDTSSSSENVINEKITENKIIEKRIEDINVLSLKDQMIISSKEVINIETRKTRKIVAEFAIPIFHYYRSYKESSYLFRDFYHEKISEFPIQYIILNNSYNISAKQLYEYIWKLNILYMNHPNIDTNDFWWNKDEDILSKENNNIKKCYPFVLRFFEIIPDKEDNYSIKLPHCPLCPWYTFCPGCIIDPKEGLQKLNSNMGILVDWCYLFIQKQLITFNFQFIKEIDSKVISENLPIIDKDHYKSIENCFNLFFKEENLEDPLYCPKCQIPQDFSKRYSINKLPYILILSLKRFIFNQNDSYKLKQMITYPLYD